MSERVCVIHIGTHKTGTTSQQYFLMQHADEFAQAGLLFPKTGWYGVVPGHHALAWELASHPRGPLFAELLAEMEASGLPSAILSAEDFSLLGQIPGSLEALADGLRSIGYTPKILVYLRAQGPFVESMYVERVKHDHVRPVADFLSEVLRTGRYSPDGSILPLEFHYTRMLAPFANVFGKENIVVHTYEGARDLTRVFTDFFATFSNMAGIFSGTDVSIEIANPVINESLSFVRLLGTAFTRLQPGKDVPATAEEFAARFAPDLPSEYANQKFALFQRPDYEALLASVAPDNLEVERLYGAQVPFTVEADIPSVIDPVWAKALIERRIYDRCVREWSEEQTNTDDR